MEVGSPSWKCRVFGTVLGREADMDDTGCLTMSAKELDRLEIPGRVLERRLTQARPRSSPRYGSIARCQALPEVVLALAGVFAYASHRLLVDRQLAAEAWLAAWYPAGAGGPNSAMAPDTGSTRAKKKG
jgi:hypothetical protein